MRLILFWKPLDLPAKGDNRSGSISGQTTWAVRDVPRPYFGVSRQHSGGQTPAHSVEIRTRGGCTAANTEQKEAQTTKK